MMKKYIISLMLSALLFLSAGQGSFAFAATQGGAVISIENKSANPGELVDISVRGHGFQNILLFEFWIVFNSDLLSGDVDLKNYITNLHPRFGNAQFNLVNDSIIGINWFRLSPINIEDGAKLFDLRLTYCQDGEACSANNGLAEIRFMEEHSFLAADGLVAIPLTFNNGSVYTSQPAHKLSLSFSGYGSAEVNGQSYNGAIDAEPGSILNLSALASTGSQFKNWTNGSQQTVSNQSQFSYTMPDADVSLTAHFEPIDYTVSLSVAPAGAATISGAGTYRMGDAVVVEATAAEGYLFVNWTNGNGSAVSTNTKYSFSMPAANISLKANFAEIIPDTYQLTLQASPAAGGTVNGGGEQ
jgi:uncharacterized repeat protein (TIGR02543 family)